MSMPTARIRHVHGHEIEHRALPWHQAAYYGDDSTTLVPDVCDTLEAQANAFSAELLFGERFTRESDDVAPGIAVPLSMTDTFAVPAHAALRRYAEATRHDVAVIGMGRFTQHTRGGPALPIWPGQCASSATYTARYGHIKSLVGSPMVVENVPAPAAVATSGCPAMAEDAGDIVRMTLRGRVRFQVDALANTRSNFLVLSRRRLTSGRVVRAS